MKNLLTFVFCVLMLTANAQQKNSVFRILDADTKKPVPYAAVSLTRAKLAINTEEDGLLTIPGEVAKIRDTIFISVQNYFTLKTPISRLAGHDSILMKKVPYQTIDLPLVAKGKDSTLNDFIWTDVCYFAGLHTETARFEYLQLAQLFNAPKEGVTLKRLYVYRLAHPDLLYAGATNRNQDTYVDLEHTRFRIRIYDVNNDGTPGRDLCSQIIEVKNNSDKDVPVKLDDYKIVIPGKRFFVAIEWIRCFTNAGYSMQRSEKNLIYKPTIGISPIKGEKLNMFGLTFAHKWQPFTYFSPDWTDLAVKAQVVW